MPFNDLLKEGVLRPEELFKYRVKRDCTIPSKGGQKEFSPDGTWLQQKRVETFMQERTSLLSEPRVEKLRNVVEGVWDEHKRLVNLKKPGKFWMYMGFTDERRNWLYPEEALYLMETNTLELFFKDRPMSIQEAYVKMLGHGMCLEEYQVFAHLRRLGYVVLRHEEERIFTDYERQINLDQYVDKKKRKELLKKGKGKSNKKISRNNEDLDEDDDSNKPVVSDDKVEPMDSSNTLNGANDIDSTSSNHSTKRSLPETDDSDNDHIKKQKLNHTNGESDCLQSSSSSPSSLYENDPEHFYHVSSWSSCFKSKPHSKEVKNGNIESEDNHHLTQTVLDPSSVDFLPNISNCITSSSSVIKPPLPELLPTDVEFSESDVDFTIEQVKAAYHQRHITMCHIETGMKDKVFSCLEACEKVTKIKAGNWCEYKRKRAQERAGMGSSYIVDHLWKDTVTPLMRPSEITSYKDVLDRLNIIGSADTEALTLDCSAVSGLPKVSFDVHLPDHCFKKTMPGAPNHRVCVSRCDGMPPGLTAIQHYSNKYQDGVPLHWAVVDSGDIAFYVFDNTRTVEHFTDQQ